MNKYFNLENRKKLQFLLSEGFSLTIIQEKLNITRMTLYVELKKGLDKEEYANKQYVKYSYIKAIESEIKKYVGMDSLIELKGLDDDEGII